ncbi:MAG: hypothetical protein RJA70_2375 [Pseudomonadota bacterium]
MRIRYAFGPLVSALTYLALAPSTAHASCDAPPSEVLWSYPADAAVEVPIDAQLRILPAPSAVTLNGKALKVSDTLSFDPGPLEPETEYSIVVTFQDNKTKELTFTTGTEKAYIHKFLGIHTSETADESSPRGIPDDLCGSLLQQQTCADTNGYYVYTFGLQFSLVSPTTDMPATEVTAFTIRIGDNVQLWPAECGEPKLLTLNFDRSQGCAMIGIEGIAGTVGEPNKSCWTGGGAPDTGADVDAGAVVDPEQHPDTEEEPTGEQDKPTTTRPVRAAPQKEPKPEVEKEPVEEDTTSGGCSAAGGVNRLGGVAVAPLLLALGLMFRRRGNQRK